MQGSFPNMGSLQGDSLVRTYRLRENVLALPGRVPAYFGRLFDSWRNLPPSTSSSKTSLAYLPAIKDATLESSSVRWMNSGTVWRGECLTLKTLESPSVVVACSLSDVLETENVPPKYSLSPKACEGILRRATRRGKKLPPSLESALRAVGGASPQHSNEGGESTLTKLTL